MQLAVLRRFCRSLPAATESIQWGDVLVYKVGGKMFATISREKRSAPTLSLKVSEDSFHILTRETGVVPAPYLARAGWVMLENLDILPAAQLRAYLTRAHALIAARLPKRLRLALSGE